MAILLSQPPACCDHRGTPLQPAPAVFLGNKGKFELYVALVTVVLLPQNTHRKQLRRRKVCFGSWLQKISDHPGRWQRCVAGAVHMTVDQEQQVGIKDQVISFQGLIFLLLLACPHQLKIPWPFKIPPPGRD